MTSLLVRSAIQALAAQYWYVVNMLCDLCGTFLANDHWYPAACDELWELEHLRYFGLSGLPYVMDFPPYAAPEALPCQCWRRRSKKSSPTMASGGGFELDRGRAGTQPRPHAVLLLNLVSRSNIVTNKFIFATFSTGLPEHITIGTPNGQIEHVALTVSIMLKDMAVLPNFGPRICQRKTD